MNLQLIKNNDKLPVLYVHCDEEEILNFVYKWKEDILSLSENNPFIRGLPIGRFDINTLFCDLLYHLGKYYTKTIMVEVLKVDHICTLLKAFNEEDTKGEDIIKIKF